MKGIARGVKMPEEYVYLVDENNKVMGKVTRSEMRKKNLPHRGTNAFIFNSKGEILLTQRTKTKDLFPELFEIGQGGCLAYGEEYGENAIRELEEEVGIKNAELEYLFDIYYKDENQNTFWKVYKCIYDGEIKMQKEEVADYFFISVEKLKKMIEETPEKFTPDGLAAFKKYMEEGNNA